MGARTRARLHAREGRRRGRRPFVGSFNLSRSGERNAENVLEIHDAATADRLARYVDEFRAPLPARDAADAARRRRAGGVAERPIPPMSTQASTTGPLGQPRGIAFAIIITIVTLGIYSLYWVFKTQDEVKEHSGIGVGGVLGLVIYILLSPVTWFLIPSDVGKMFKADGRPAVHRLDRPLAAPPADRDVRLVHQDPGRAEPLLGEQVGVGAGSGDGLARRQVTPARTRYEAVTHRAALRR